MSSKRSISDLVLAGELGALDLPKEEIYGKYGPRVDPIPVPYFIGDIDHPQSWIQPVETEPLRFHTVNAGAPDDVTLIPFYQLFGQRYAIYWEIEGKEKER